MRAFPVSLPSGQRYWTVLDEDLQVVGIADEYLRHQRFGRDGAESTTKAYARRHRAATGPHLQFRGRADPPGPVPGPGAHRHCDLRPDTRAEHRRLRSDPGNDAVRRGGAGEESGCRTGDFLQPHLGGAV
jgi:hypothetical protein